MNICILYTYTYYGPRDMYYKYILCNYIGAYYTSMKTIYYFYTYPY